MANPPNAKPFAQPMDPADVVDYAVTLTRGPATADLPFPLLEATEQVASFALTATAEAVAAGLTIATTGSRAPTLVGDLLKFWLSIDGAMQSSALFAGTGLDLAIELTVVTAATPSRTRQRTLTVKVAQQ